MEDCVKRHKELVTKRIFVVQHITEGTVWNNTYVTQSLKTLNVKIDCQSGKVLSENLQSILSMTRQVK
jgi:hypothetical protein